MLEVTIFPFTDLHIAVAVIIMGEIFDLPRAVKNEL